MKKQIKTREKEFKSFDLELKDMNDSTGEVAFYFAAWGKDLDNDTILNSAYTKTFKENSNNFYHNRDHKEACGKPSQFGVDSKGAFCVSQLAINTIVGKDTYEQYKAGLIKGHSQEFETIQSEPDMKGGRFIKEVKLWGVTSVTNIPANLDTPTISIKSANDLVLQMKKINDILHNGNISDALGEKFCEEYKKLSKLVVRKNAAMANAGIVHCDNCKSIIPPDEMDDSEENDNENQTNVQMVYSKCNKCGRFINKNTGKMRPMQMMTAEGLKTFKLF